MSQDLTASASTRKTFSLHSVSSQDSMNNLAAMDIPTPEVVGTWNENEVKRIHSSTQSTSIMVKLLTVVK